MINSWTEFIIQSQHNRSFVNKNIKLHINNIRFIREHKYTKRILYNDCYEPFDYVHSLYPGVGVKNATVFYTLPTVLQEAGFIGLGGFYDLKSRIVIITDCVDSFESKYQSKYTLDEVLCHELIHYASSYSSPMSSKDLEEEIAYGLTIPYLQSKNYSDSDIIQNHLLAYLSTIVDKSKIYKTVLTKNYSEQSLLHVTSVETLELLLSNCTDEIEQSIMKEAWVLGQRMIDVYSRHKKNTLKEIPSEYQKIDIDDDI